LSELSGPIGAWSPRNNSLQLKTLRDEPLFFTLFGSTMAKEDMQPKAEQMAPAVAPEEDEPDEW
jgi:hypothetical protein